MENSQSPASGQDWITRLVSQFSGPHGWLGHLAGFMMARKNGALNAWVVEQLGAGHGSRVLEIGFGPGLATALLVERSAIVAGIDKSEVMVTHASRRNRAALRAGRVELKHGTADHLPFADASFTHALAVNSFQFWPDRSRALGQIRRVLQPGGRLLLAQRMRDEGGSRTDRRRYGMTDQDVDGVEALLTHEGFNLVGRSRRLIGDETICTIAAQLSPDDTDLNEPPRAETQ